MPTQPRLPRACGQANYDEGHYCSAERFLIKESDVPHITIELDKPGGRDHCTTAQQAMAFLKASVVLTQTARVQTNTMACTWSYSTLDGEARNAYGKLQKVCMGPSRRDGAHTPTPSCPAARGDGRCGSRRARRVLH